MVKKPTTEKNKTKTKQKYSFKKSELQLKKKYGLRLGMSVRRRTPASYLLKSNTLDLMFTVNRQIARTAKLRSPKRHIRFLKKIMCRRGIRHRYFLPCRGQKTKANGKTKKKMRGKAQNYPLRSSKKKLKKNAKKKSRK
jgi:ribosomal protein S13